MGSTTPFWVESLAIGIVLMDTILWYGVLLEALRDQENRVRNAAAVILGSFEKQKEAILPALAEALQDKDSWVRLGAAQSIWRLNPGDRRVVEVLIGVLRDGDPDLRNEAAATLKSFDPKAAKDAGVR